MIYIRLLDAFLMLHGRRALAWVGGFRRRHTRMKGQRNETRPAYDTVERRLGMLRIEGERWVR